MTDQTTVPTAPTRRPTPEDVWNRLLGDAAAFAAEHPDDLPVQLAFVAWEALILGHAQGVRDAAGRTREQLLAVVPDVAAVVNRAMGQAYADDGAGPGHYPTLRRLAHAGERARAASSAAAETKGGNCDG